MQKPAIEIPTERIVEICRVYQVRELALFGSVLSDNFGPDSDVDFLVEFKPQTSIGFLALARMQCELSDLIKRPVDLVPKRSLKPQIRDSVLAYAQVIYAA